MFKLGRFTGGEWQAHSHSPVFLIEQCSGGVDKILSVAPGSDALVLAKLCDQLTPPLFLLYILHTPRGEGSAGRYQSEEMSSDEVRQFLRDFSDFLSADGRFDLWVHSPTDNATIVWDRHDLIHAYGQIDRTIEVLRGLGFYPGNPEIPSPHQHNYHAECDGQAKALMISRKWEYSPLHEEDDQ